MGIAIPQIASAGHWNNACTNGCYVHKANKGHLPAFSFYNRAGDSWTVLEHARGDWSGQSAAMDLGNVVNDGADVVAWDGRYCAPEWAGIMTTFTYSGGNGTIYSDGHSDQMRVQLDTCDTQGNYAYGRAVACHEIGHATAGVFEDYFASAGGPGCMGVGYAPGQENIYDARWRSPNAHDLDHASHLWRNLH